MSEIICPYCGNAPQLMDGADLFSAKWAGSKYYVCIRCDARIGAKNDGSPKGRMAARRLRELRRSIHRVVDPLWMDHPRGRRAAVYRLLYSRTGVERIGETTEEECESVILFLCSQEYESLRQALADPAASAGDWLRGEAMQIALAMDEEPHPLKASPVSTPRVRMQFVISKRGDDDPFSDCRVLLPHELIWQWRQDQLTSLAKDLV